MDLLPQTSLNQGIFNPNTVKEKRHKQIKQNESSYKAFMDLAAICIQLMQSEIGEHELEHHNLIINSNSKCLSSPKVI